MSKYFLNTYRPLCSTNYGREAIDKFNLPPFVDGSCRREPDFESKFPSITAICRLKKFAPRLWPGDKIVYLTVQGKYSSIKTQHYRLVSILEVVERFENHSDAANWYLNKNLEIPSNCLIKNNPPKRLEFTLGSIPERKIKRFDKYPDKNRNIAFTRFLSDWDDGYWERIKICSVFVVCKKHYLELREPTVIYPAQLRNIFGKIPGTQNPPEITNSEFNLLYEFVKIGNNT